MTDRLILPDDQDQFKLNEVCKLANVQPYMLRFWGTEFPQLEAEKSGTGQRLYSQGPGRADPRDPPPAVRRGPDHRRRPQEGHGDGGWRRKASRPRPRSGGRGEDSRGTGGGAQREAQTTEDEQRPPQDPEKGRIAAKVDKETPPDVQPLLATLKNVRDEVEKIVDDLKAS